MLRPKIHPATTSYFPKKLHATLGSRRSLLHIIFGSWKKFQYPKLFEVFATADSFTFVCFSERFPDSSEAGISQGKNL
jgi:hypothetical protein